MSLRPSGSPDLSGLRIGEREVEAICLIGTLGGDRRAEESRATIYSIESKPLDAARSQF